MGIELHNGDCLEVMDKLIASGVKIDLVIADPPYNIKNTKAGGHSCLAKSFQKVNDEIKSAKLTDGVSLDFCERILRLQNKINIYIWCNEKQILDYLNFFVGEHKCSFTQLNWYKKNAVPTFHNKYLSDKECCLYFRKGGYCQPIGYEEARTFFYQPINIKDKKLYNHPTIKPLNIIERLLKNSTKKGDTVLDPFMGSGTTGVACKNLDRNFIGVELDKKYFYTASNRINGELFRS